MLRDAVILLFLSNNSPLLSVCFTENYYSSVLAVNCLYYQGSSPVVIPLFLTVRLACY